MINDIKPEVDIKEEKDGIIQDSSESSNNETDEETSDKDSLNDEDKITDSKEDKIINSKKDEESITDNKTEDTESEENIESENDIKLEISQNKVNKVTSSYNNIASPSNAKSKNRWYAEDEDIDNSEQRLMDVYIIDDFIDITTDDGYRTLEPDEYNLVNVTIPSRKSFVNANGFAIDSDKYMVYIIEGDYRTGEIVESFYLDDNRHNYMFNKGVTKFAIKIEGLSESLYFNNQDIEVSIEFNLNQDSILSDSGYIRNLDALVVEYAGIKDNIVDIDSYINDGDNRVSNRDMYTYDSYMQRDYHQYPYDTDILYHNINVYGNGFKDEYRGYTSELAYTSYLNKGNNINGYTVYSILPLGMNVDYDKVNNNTFCNNMYDSSGEELSSLDDYFTLEFIEDFRGSGRTLIRGTYKFEDGITTEDNSYSYFNVPVIISYNNLVTYGKSYTLNVEQIVDVRGMNSSSIYNWNNGKDNGEALSDDESLWADINDNENESEDLVYSSWNDSIVSIRATHIEILKTVSTPRTYNKYITNLTDSSTSERKDIWASFDNEYSYKLNVVNIGNPVRNLVIYDVLETGAYNDTDNKKHGSDWKGTFDHIDLSGAESLGMNPKVYYSTSSDRNQLHNIDNLNWKEEVPSNKEDIKAIAVDFGDDYIRTSEDIYVEIFMKAPSENINLKEKITVNDFSITYNEDEKVKELDSGQVYVKIDVPKGLLSINKLDSVDKKELSGYKFGLYNVENELVAEITEDGMSVDGVEIGEYTLREMIAPKGYEKIPDRKVDINLGLTTMNIEDPRIPGSVTLKKVDSSNNMILEGAKFELYDSKNNLIDGNLVTDSKGSIEVKNLEWGSYYFKEIEAPEDHYLYGNTITKFIIDSQNTHVDLKVENRHLGSVLLIKEDKDNTNIKVEGATYNLYNRNDKLLGSYVTNGDGEISVKGLEWGSYYFKEDIPAQGYELNDTTINFSISKYSSVEQIELKTYDYEMTSSIEIIKRHVMPGVAWWDEDIITYLQGALFRLEKYNDITDSYITLGTYRTDGSGKILIEDLKFGKYKITEVKAPRGYVISEEPSEVELNKDTVDTVVQVYVENERKKGCLEIYKTDDMGNPLEGAEFKLYKDDYEEPLDLELISNESGLIKAGDLYNPILEWGHYRLVEIKAPKGYDIGEEVEFDINSETVENVINLDIVNNRHKGSVKLIKTDKDDKDTKVKGAVYKLFRIDGTYVTEKETDDAGEIIFDDIEWGSYYLEESYAPLPYSISQGRIRFSINKDNCTMQQVLEAEDEKGKVSIVIEKSLNSEDDVYNDFGSPSFMYKIEGYDTDNIKHTWYREITLNKDTLSGKAVIDSMPLSNENGYKITELNSNRYQVIDIQSSNGDIIKDKTEDSIILNVSDLNVNGTVISFTNKLDKWDKYSHTSNALNMINSKARNFLYLEVEYTGPYDISDRFNENYEYNIADDTEFLNKYLKVTAYYNVEDENGDVTKVLKPGEYSIDPEILPCKNGEYDYTVNVSYTDYGKTRSGSFSVYADTNTEVFRVMYHYNGTVTMSRYPKDKEITLYNPESEDGFEFIGWTLNEDGSGDIINKFTNTEGSSIVHLYAKYEAKKYKITYSFTDEASNKDELVYEYSSNSEDITLPNLVGSRKFLGWSGSNGTEPELDVVIESGSTGDRHYIANWNMSDITMLLPGQEFNEILKEEYGDEYDNNIRDIAVMTSTNIASIDKEKVTLIDIDVSTTNSQYPIYIGSSFEPYINDYNEHTYYKKLWIISEASEIYTNYDASSMLSGLDLRFWKDTNNFNTRYTISFNSMFECSGIEDTSFVEYWDTSNVVDMSYMFNNSTIQSVKGLGDWNVSNVIDMSSMFEDCTRLKSLEGLESWKTEKLSNMSSLFAGDYNIGNIEALKHWDTSNVKDMSYMFSNSFGTNGHPSFNGVLSNWDVSNVEYMNAMFSRCGAWINFKEISNWNTGNVRDMSYLFSQVDIWSEYTNDMKSCLWDISNWDTSNVVNMYAMFNNNFDNKFDLNAISNWDVNKCLNFGSMFRSNYTQVYNIDGISNWKLNTEQDIDFTNMFEPYDDTHCVSEEERKAFQFNRLPGYLDEDGTYIVE